MKDLEVIKLDTSVLVLENARVKSSIIPQASSQMDRDIEIRGETVIDGAVYARNLKIDAGPLTVGGSVFAGNDILVSSAVSNRVRFHKAVACHDGITALPDKGSVHFGADINAQTIKLKNCFVAANVFASTVSLENCVVLGGVFATRQLELTNVVVGTFNSPSVKLSGNIFMLLPSAFSVEPVACSPDLNLCSLALADLGNLIRGLPELPKTGKIRLDPAKDSQKTTLSDDQGNRILLETYSVAGRVLAADLLDFEKLQNHFLLAVGALGEQLWKQYDLGCDKDGRTVPLNNETIATFFTSIIKGDIHVSDLSGEFSFKEFVDAYKSV